MIIKRIRKCAKRKRRPLAQVRAVVQALTAYSIDADPELLLELSVDRIRQANYVLDSGAWEELGVEPGEKVDAHGTRNLIGNGLLDHQRQMIAACLLAPGAKDPIEHYVVSWRAGEIPDDEQIEEVLDIFAAEMGFDDCQILWATHSNTANRHLHLVVNRVDLARGRIVSPGEGWEIDRLHQVIALIEDRQGWSSEPNSIYSAKAGVVIDRTTQHVVRRADGSREGCYKRKIVAPEIGQEEANKKIVTALRAATSWRDLHYRLAAENAAYAIKGSGAQIFIDDKPMRASHFGREFSYKKMVCRLGDYDPDLMQSRDPHELYQQALRDERGRVREALNAALAHVREKRRLALKRLRRLERDEYLKALDEARMELAFDRVEAAIKQEFDVVRRTIAASYLNRERWYKAGQPAAEPVILPGAIIAGEDPRDPAIAEEYGFWMHAHEAGADYYDEAGTRAISDLGVILLVHKRDIAAVELALGLASARGSTITASGSAEFLDLCRDVAIRRGFHLVAEDGTSLVPRDGPSPPGSANHAKQRHGSKEARQSLGPDVGLDSPARQNARQDMAIPTLPIQDQHQDEDARLAELAAAVWRRAGRNGRG